jgi:tetratricopeptide (TPR) repeat protein
MVLLGTSVGLGIPVALELGLRLVGFGHPTSFFLDIPGKAASGTNPNYANRYFAASYANQPAPAFIPRPKPAGTYRIFVFGGSAAFGDVAPEYSFGRILELLLRDRHPQIRFQVVNAALQGIDSPMVLRIAIEAAALQPDLFILFMGNNEVVGPHGPVSVVEAPTPVRGPAPRRALPLGRWVRGLRIYQLADRLLHPAQSEALPPVPPPLDPARYLRTRIRANDPRLESVYRDFRANLEAIVEVARQSGAPVILSTVATNLVDAPPMASMNRPDLFGKERLFFERALASAKRLEQVGDLDGALRAYRRALAIDDQFAGLHYQLGSLLARAGDLDVARAHFVRARDLDVQRYRADTAINDVIRSVANDRGARRGEGIFLVDSERELGRLSASPVGLPGVEFFYDPAHLNFKANYAIAHFLLDTIERALEIPDSERPSTRPATPPRGAAARLGLSDWDRIRVNRLIEESYQNPLILGEPPGYDDTSNMRSLKGTHDLNRIRGESLRLYRNAIKRRPNDLLMRRNRALLLADLRRYGAATDQLQELLDVLPGVVGWQTSLGEVHLLAGDPHSAASALRNALRVDPNNVRANLLLGDALRAAGDLDGAVGRYGRTVRIHPYMRGARARLAFLLFEQERYLEAIPQLEALLLLDPSHERAKQRLREAVEQTGGGSALWEGAD